MLNIERIQQALDCEAEEKTFYLLLTCFFKDGESVSQSRFVLANESFICPSSHVGQALSSQFLTDKETEVQGASVTCQ